jgi:hypothetical protein
MSFLRRVVLSRAALVAVIVYSALLAAMVVYSYAPNLPNRDPEGVALMWLWAGMPSIIFVPNYFLALAMNNIILFIAVGFAAAAFAYIRTTVRH